MNQIDLLKINTSGKVEKKNGLSYLSWAWAWSEVLCADPTANFKVEMFPHGDDLLPYMSMGDSHMVWVTVTIFGKAVTCQLPVLDYRNKCIPKPNAFDINTSIMRCLTKAIAFHGLGLNIYAGEDLPMLSDEAAPSPEPQPAKAAPEPVKPAVSEQDNANAQLFSDGMHEYMKMCRTDKELRSYWKENQSALDRLKVTHPALYEGILAAFKETAAQLPKGESK